MPRPPLTPLYVLLIGLNATLVFLVQPIIGRILLPSLGGTAVVWNTCLVFFQAALLVGYLYAHLVATRLSLRQQVLIHLTALAVAATQLPLSFTATGPDSGEAPALWLFLLLVVHVGPLFMLVSAGAPLFQAWFARTDHPDAADPYHLYAASNVGSIGGLLVYPFLIEPTLSIAAQSWLWAGGYGALWLLILVTGIATTRESQQGSPDLHAEQTPSIPSTPAELAKWAALAAVPSALLIGVTTHITTDIAPMPLLWIVPLVLFLLSFVVAFAKRQLLSVAAWAALAVPAAMLAALQLAVGGSAPMAWGLALHLGAFFLVAMMFHSLLAESRPEPRKLTAFYLAMSVGGVVGGAWAALAAPLVFPTTMEYPLLLALSAALFAHVGPRVQQDPMARWMLAIAFLTAALAFAASLAHIELPRTVVPACGLVGLLIAVSLWRSAPIVTVLFLALATFLGTVTYEQTSVLHRGRSYFGTHVVDIDPDGTTTRLLHGNTIHGTQARDDDEPTMYYQRDSGVGRALAELAKRPGEKRVAVVGLGVGTLAAYAQPGLSIDFYEIDGSLVEVARNPAYFRYLDRCGTRCDIILGDARIQLAHAPEAAYDLIVEDAFNSDAVPVHLLTREAMQMYLGRLAPGGVMAFHVSNRHLDLAAVVAALARDAGLVTRIHRSVVQRGSTEWLLLARDPAHLGTLAHDPAVEPFEAPTNFPVWTDDYANILAAYR